MKTKIFSLAICLIAAFGAAYLAPSLINSFSGGAWELTPIPLGSPYIVTIIAASGLALMILLRVSAWMFATGFGKGTIFMVAAIAGTIGLMCLTAVSEYAISGIEQKSIGDFLSLSRDVAPSLIVPNLILALVMAVVGLTVGAKAFSFRLASGEEGGGGSDISGGGGFSAETPDAQPTSWIARTFRIPSRFRLGTHSATALG